MKKSTQFLLKTLLSLVLFFSIVPALIGTNNVNAEGPTDPAPEIFPANPNGMNVLFDNSHGQTAGAADWVIDGAFSDFANAISQEGYYVKELRKTIPFTYDDLKAYDVFVIPEANIPFKKTEQDAMLQFVENGGSIFFVSDHYNADRNKNRWDSSEIMNGYRRGAFEDPSKGMNTDEKMSFAMQELESKDWLSENFGIKFRYNAIGNVNATLIVPSQDTFGITEGVQSVAMHAGSTLAITDPSKAKGIVYLPTGLTNADKWNYSVDQGVYFGGGIEEGPYAAISKYGKGKAAFIGDSSPVEDATPKYVREDTGTTKKTYDGFKEQDDRKLLVNIINWLAKKENYTTFAETGIPLDNPSPQLDIEIPANSTEPQKEPWAEPEPGYKWYDSLTFKAGSYGSTITQEQKPTYSFIHQEILPNKEEFKIRLQVHNLVPGQTISDLRIGIYLDGGTQIASFQKEDGTWPTSYGYSNLFSVTADLFGQATKELTIRIKPGTEGPANLRLKHGKTNILTNQVTIDNVNSEPLPDEALTLPETISILEAREKPKGSLVTIEGVITSQPGLFGGKGFYIQDETAGIYVFQHEDGFHVGDVVKITAPTTLYNNEIELTDIISLTKTGTKALLAPKVVKEVDESNLGQRIKLENVTIDNLAEIENSFEFDVISTDGNKTRVRVDSRTGITFTQFQEQFKSGDSIHISGIASSYKNNFQLKLLTLADVEPAEKPDVLAPVIHDLEMESFFATDSIKKNVNVTDDESGVSKVTITLNDKEYENTIQIDPLQLKPGSHTLHVKAEDFAGNVSEKTFTLEIKMDVDHLDELLEIGEEQGLILNDGTAKSISSRVSSIQAEKSKKVQQTKLSSLQKYIKKHSGKKIAEEYVEFWNISA